MTPFELASNPRNRVDLAHQIDYLILHNYAKKDGVLVRDRKLIPIGEGRLAETIRDRDISTIKILLASLKKHMPGRQIVRTRGEAAFTTLGLTGIGSIFRRGVDYDLGPIPQDYAICSAFNYIVQGGWTAEMFPPMSIVRKTDGTFKYQVMAADIIKPINVKTNKDAINAVIDKLTSDLDQIPASLDVEFGEIKQPGRAEVDTDLTRFKISADCPTSHASYQLIKKLGECTKGTIALFQTMFPGTCISTVYPDLIPEGFRGVTIGVENAGGED